MKKLIIALLFGMILPVAALADEEVQAHTFDDLNGNGISDAQENMGTITPKSDTIEDETLAPTPDDEPSDPPPAE